MVTAGTAQAIALAGALGLDPQLFLDMIAGGPLDLPYAQLKGKSMIADEFPTSFAVSGVVKDLGLIAAAMRGADVHDGSSRHWRRRSGRRTRRATATRTWPPSSTPSARGAELVIPRRVPTAAVARDRRLRVRVFAATTACARSP